MSLISPAVQDVLAAQYKSQLEFGQENWPDGTDSRFFARPRDVAMEAMKLACERQRPTFGHFALAGLYGCLSTEDPVRLRAELVWTTAQMVEWIEALDRRASDAR